MLEDYIEQLYTEEEDSRNIINLMNESNKIEYRKLIQKFETDSDKFFDDTLNQIRFYLDLIIFTHKKNNDIEIIIKLFDKSINIMNNLSRKRERNHIVVEITQELLNINHKFDKSNFIKKIIETVEQIYKEKDPDLNWVNRDIKKLLEKSDYKDFLKKLDLYE